MLKGFENGAEAVRGLVTVIMWQIHGFRAKLADRERLQVLQDEDRFRDFNEGRQYLCMMQ